MPYVKHLDLTRLRSSDKLLKSTALSSKAKKKQISSPSCVASYLNHNVYIYQAQVKS